MGLAPLRQSEVQIRPHMALTTVLELQQPIGARSPCYWWRAVRATGDMTRANTRALGRPSRRHLGGSQRSHLAADWPPPPAMVPLISEEPSWPPRLVPPGRTTPSWPAPPRPALS